MGTVGVTRVAPLGAVLLCGVLLAAVLLAGVGCPGGAELKPDSKVDMGDTGVVFADVSWLGDSAAPDVAGDSAPTCATTCGGCCTALGSCEPGSTDNACGKGGSDCADCTLVSGRCENQYCLGCKASCTGKPCGAGDGCGGSCAAGSGCCTPSCTGKVCGAGDGCGGSCAAGSGCCTPSCSGKTCGAGDGCGGSCEAGSGCCQPSCSGKLCGQGNGCGGTCNAGSGCCTPSCSGKACGQGDGCGGTCSSGSCPTNEICQSNTCVCKNAAYHRVGGVCIPSCGALLNDKGLTDQGAGCCNTPCAGSTGGGPGSTWDCSYCCENPPGCL